MTTILRPMSTGELLDRTFSLYRQHFKLFVGIAVVAQIPYFAIQLGEIPLQGMRARSVIAGAGLVLLAAVVYLATLAASQGAAVIAVSAVYLDQPTGIAAAYAKIRSRIAELVLIMVGTWIGVLFGFMLLLVPGVIFTLMWALIIPVAVLENSGLAKSAQRSRQLTKGNRGRISVILGLFLVLSYIVMLLFNLPMFAALGIAHGSLLLPVWVQVFNIGTNSIGQALVAPLLTIALSLEYYDARVRKEGYDIQLMMDSLQPQPAQTAGATS